MSESARNKGDRAKADGSFINQGDHMVAEWTEEGTDTNAVATATRAAAADRSHYIVGIIASFDAAAIAQLTLDDDVTTILTQNVHNEAVIMLPKPIEITKGNAVSASLAAGGSSVVGNVTLIGYTG